MTSEISRPLALELFDVELQTNQVRFVDWPMSRRTDAQRMGIETEMRESGTVDRPDRRHRQSDHRASARLGEMDCCRLRHQRDDNAAPDVSGPDLCPALCPLHLGWDCWGRRHWRSRPGRIYSLQ